MRLNRNSLRRLILKEMADMGMGAGASVPSGSVAEANKLASEILSLAQGDIQYDGADAGAGFTWKAENGVYVSGGNFGWSDSFKKYHGNTDRLTIDFNNGTLSFDYYDIIGNIGDLPAFVQQVLGYSVAY